jgi:hypothetical protein
VVGHARGAFRMARLQLRRVWAFAEGGVRGEQLASTYAALPPRCNRVDDTLHVGILPGRAGRRADRLDVHGRHSGRDGGKRAIAIMQEIAGASFSGKAFRSCWAVQGAVGYSVTATWMIRRRSCATMTST